MKERKKVTTPTLSQKPRQGWAPPLFTFVKGCPTLLSAFVRREGGDFDFLWFSISCSINSFPSTYTDSNPQSRYHTCE
jgi:hypothetical protein